MSTRQNDRKKKKTKRNKKKNEKWIEKRNEKAKVHLHRCKCFGWTHIHVSKWLLLLCRQVFFIPSLFSSSSSSFTIRMNAKEIKRRPKPNQTEPKRTKAKRTKNSVKKKRNGKTISWIETYTVFYTLSIVITKYNDIDKYFSLIQ